MAQSALSNVESVSPSMTLLDKIAITSLGASVGSKVLIWQLGQTIETASQLVLPVLNWRVLDVFAWLGFAAFDLVVISVLVDARRYGSRPSGFVALTVACMVAMAIGLDAGGVINWPALQAAPGLTLLAYGAHLMVRYPSSSQKSHKPAAAASAEREQPRVDQPQLSVTTQIVNMPPTPAPLPATVRDFVRERVRLLTAEHGELSLREIGAQLGTSADTVRRAMADSVETDEGVRSE